MEQETSRRCVLILKLALYFVTEQSLAHLSIKRWFFVKINISIVDAT